MRSDELEKLKKKASEIRKQTIDAIGYFGLGHLGGAMSIVEVLTLLYYRYIETDPKDRERRDRDYLVLSKGHAGPTLYSILADKGFFPKSWLRTLNRDGTNLPSHCDRVKTPGVDMTAGALGQGLSVGVGIALGNRLDEIDRNVYVIIGDGESNEGQIWEAAMAAAHFKLTKIIAFTDYNKLQVDGYTYEIMDIDDITSKWLSFGWYVQRVDGHNFVEMDRAIINAQNEKQRPSMIVLDTVKGKGAFFAEGKVSSHHMLVDYETAKEAIGRIPDC
jgi:transketolase